MSVNNPTALRPEGHHCCCVQKGMTPHLFQAHSVLQSFEDKKRTPPYLFGPVGPQLELEGHLDSGKSGIRNPSLRETVPECQWYT